jgi:hypothetical protein
MSGAAAAITTNEIVSNLFLINENTNGQNENANDMKKCQQSEAALGARTVRQEWKERGLERLCGKEIANSSAAMAVTAQARRTANAEIESASRKIRAPPGRSNKISCSGTRSSPAVQQQKEPHRNRQPRRDRDRRQRRTKRAVDE